MAKRQALRPGMDAPRRGKYIVIGPRGGVRGTVTMRKSGHTLPPTEKPNSTFRKG